MLVIELEEFLVHRDRHFPDQWVIRPLAISELWKFVLGNDWDITYHEHPELDLLFDNLRKHWKSGEAEYGEDILICQVEVEYSFTVPPGARSLRHGRHTWSDTNEFWHMVGSHSSPWKIVGGIVRTIRVVPVLQERDHAERRSKARREVDADREVSRQANTSSGIQEGADVLPQS